MAVDEAIRAEIVYRASFGRADDIKLLVDEGASPNQSNSDGVPLMSIAAVRNDPEAVNVIIMLIKLRGNINASDPKGQNALFYASRSGNLDVVNTLLAYGINHKAFDTNGDTARIAASKAGHPEIVTALDDFARGQNQKVNKIKKELQLKKQEQERLAAEKAAAIDNAMKQVGVATAPAEVAASTSAARSETPVEPNHDLVAITDSISEVKIQNDIDDATLAAGKTPDAEVHSEPGVESLDMDETHNEVEVAQRKSELNEHLEKSTETSNADQLKEFEAIIKTPVEPNPEPAPDPNHISAADKAQLERVIPSGKIEKTPEQIAEEKEILRRKRAEKELQRKQDIKNMAYEVALHTCAFQYWAYVMQVRQSSELGSEELTIAVQSNKDQAEALQKKLVVNYGMPVSFYDNITKSAQLRIYNQLNRMPSNRMRHEYGVGKMDDMKTRCEEIARQWGFPASLKAQPAGKQRKKNRQNPH